VELLAVIVILAIILAIAIPGINNVIDLSKRSAFESDTKMVLKKIDYEQLVNDSFNPNEINETNIKEKLNLDDSNYQAVEVFSSNGKPYIVIEGKNRWSSLTTYGTYANITVVKSDEYESSFPYLSSLSISEMRDGGITPIFEKRTMSYTSTVPSSKTSATIVPTAENSQSIIKVNNQIVASGETSQSIDLIVGVTTVIITVSSSDNDIETTYTIKITRQS
jgi:type II secretory pathway pseudopilin PulG